MKICSILLLISMGLSSGCAVFTGRESLQTPETAEISQSIEASQASDEFSRRDSAGDFSNSSFVANDFLSVVVRVPDFVPGETRFSSALPRTRYGEILLETLRQAGFAIVLGDAANVPALSYSIELPSEHSPDVHTFFVRLGTLELKRSYEIFGERIAPVSEMLMAGVDPAALRRLPAAQVVESDVEPSTFATTPQAESFLVESAALPTPSTVPSTVSSTVSSPVSLNSSSDDLGVQRVNELVNTDDDWSPLDVNLYETGESVYEPMFADATRDYESISTQVLIFPNDSLVLGNENKDYLFDLAEQVRETEDIIRVVGCSHGNSQLANGNEKLAKGRAVRVREELLLAGVDDSAILHEACWANVHFDETFPRRGVVVIHLRPQG